MTIKPLGRKAYGSIPHLPNSRTGPADWSCHEGQDRICTVCRRDGKDTVVVQQKLDGSCCAVARVGDEIIALGRAGFPSVTSPYIQHWMFAWWVKTQERRFLGFLKDGERVVGEWLAQAHGTRYNLPHEPFVVFDIMVEAERKPFLEVMARCAWGGDTGRPFVMPQLISYGPAVSTAGAMQRLSARTHGANDNIEGVVYRVERDGKVDFLAKYVDHDKVDGAYLPEISGASAPAWNRYLGTRLNEMFDLPRITDWAQEQAAQYTQQGETTTDGSDL